jgi:hypothetical protein
MIREKIMTRKTLLLLLCIFPAQALGSANAYSRDYYISPAGSDSNPGTQSEPWRTIAKVNDTDFQPGDQVHFQGGERSAGTIELDSNDGGTSKMRLIVTSYGDGRAVIDGQDGSGLSANGCNYLVVKNLNFIGSGRKGGNTQNGVSVMNGQGVEIDRVEPARVERGSRYFLAPRGAGGHGDQPVTDGQGFREVVRPVGIQGQH